MRAQLPCILLALVAVPANAFEIEDCKYASKAARDIMEIRQSGTPASEVIENIDDFYGERHMPESSYELIKQTIIDAYKWPQYASSHNKQRAIANFENFWFLSCMEKADE